MGKIFMIFFFSFFEMRIGQPFLNQLLPRMDVSGWIKFALRSVATGNKNASKPKRILRTRK